jgi:protein SCO1/2
MNARRAIVTIAFCLHAAMQAWGAGQHTAQGILLQVDNAKGLITVSCDAIPGYMEAMEMPFQVRETALLKTLVPGSTVRFTMVDRDHKEYAEHLEMIQVTNHESEPIEAGRLTYLQRLLNPAAAATIVPVGQLVPDFALTDQAQHLTHLADFRGKVVALTFTYSRCPNPNYCFRLSNNLSVLARRFHKVAGRDLILVTIVIDPGVDQGKALERYADTWKADPATWHFLTGKLPDVRSAAELFGMDFWNDEGFLIHTFHTVVIDREGRLAANLEGNQFTAEQLGDLVETVMRRPYQGARTTTANAGTAPAPGNASHP